jgi:putative nucleotidyltransferase with HDIG domain
LKKILLVEDDPAFRNILAGAISDENIKVTESCDGQDAKDYLRREDFDLVVSDVRMPNVHGIELLHWIQKKHKYIPVVLMSGASDIEEDEAADIGASGYLQKPFRPKAFLEVIKPLLKEDSTYETHEEPEEEKPVGYLRLGIDEFLSGRNIPYPVFIKLRSGRVVKIAHKSEDLDYKQLENYKTRGVTFLYLDRDDFKQYLSRHLIVGKAMKQTKKIAREKKQEFMKQTGDMLLESVFVEGVDDEKYASAKEYMDSTFALVEDEDDMMSLLMQLNQTTDHLYSHSLGVSIYGVMIAKQMGWKSLPSLFKVSLSGLLHDIGKKELDKELIDKPRTELSAKEVRLLESHPSRGMEILNNLKKVSEDVIQATYQSHENCSGFGYPNGLSKNKISPLSRLVSVADVFCYYAIKNPDSEGMSAKAAYHKMITLKGEQLDGQFLKALSKVCQA